MEPLLRGNDVFSLHGAAEVLSTWASADEVPIVVAALNNLDAEVRRIAFVTLARLKDPGCVADVAARLSRPEDRQSAIETLRAVGPENVKAADRSAVCRELTALLADNDDQTRRTGVHLMTAWATIDELPEIIHVSEDENANVRWAAIDALGKFKDGRAAKAIADRLENIEDREKAIRALITMGELAIPESERLLHDHDRLVRVAAASILRSIQKVKAAPGKFDILLALADLHDPNDGVRLLAAQALSRAELQDKLRSDVAEALEELLKDRHPNVRAEAARALVTWGGPDNVPALIDALSEQNKGVVVPVMESLGKLKDRRAAAPIAQYLENFFLREHAARALKALGPQAERVVLEYLGNANPSVRLDACNVLQSIGTIASVRPLQQATMDRNPQVAQAAQAALLAMSRRPPAKATSKKARGRR
jgi:HEAT repeat protein